MDKQYFMIEHSCRTIPAILWGAPCGRLLLAVHGMQSHKEDAIIALAAETAAAKGFCTLSFDLPEHGQRAAAVDYPCNPWNGRSDFLTVYHYAETMAEDISIFACSLGAYLTMLAYGEIAPKQILFLSPVVSMEHIIENSMAAAGVTAEQLEKKKRVPLPDAPALDWEYYRYVKEHPIEYNPNYFISPARPAEKTPMAILCGKRDSLCDPKDVAEFSGGNGAELTVLSDGEHYFHTEGQLNAVSMWLDEYMSPVNAAPWLAKLTDKDNNRAYHAMEFLRKESRRWDSCYPFLEPMALLLEHKNSFVRSRAIALIAANAHWDTEDKIDVLLEGLLCHVTDEKPVTARQCIQALPELAAAKPELAGRIRAALLSADVSGYRDSMRPLIETDIMAALKTIQGETEASSGPLHEG